MNDIEEELNQAAKTLTLSDEEFAKCDPESAKWIAQKAQDTFVLDNPRSWWLSLKYPFDSFDYPEGFGFEDLVRHVPEGEERCWLIPETEKEDPLVFDTKISCITPVLGQCSYFEYYLVGKTFDWLIVENDHNQIIVSRIPPRADT